MYKMLPYGKRILLVANYIRETKSLYVSGSGSKEPDKTLTSVSKADDGSKTCDVCKSCPCECNPSEPSMYERRKYSHNLPSDSEVPHFETLPNLPSGIFRATSGEVLGRGAKKCSYYQNPEYFSYHHMTFYDMHMLLRSYRNASPKTGRKI